MPPKTTTWDRFTPQFAVVHFKPDGTVDYIEMQYTMQDSADPQAVKTKMLRTSAASVAMALGLANRLLVEAKDAEGV